MSYSEVRTALKEVRISIDDVWIQHLRLYSKTTPPQVYTLYPDHSIFTSFDSRWRRAQLDHLELLVEDEEEEEEELLLQWRYLRHLELLLLRLLQFLINCSRFGGFPNRRRPKCTTMPWAIWPSLMVLWGVCWMFVVPWNDANHLDAHLRDYLDEEQPQPFYTHFSLNPDLTPIAAEYDQFLDNIGSEVVLNGIPYTDYTNHSIYNDFIVNPSEQDQQEGSDINNHHLAPLPPAAVTPGGSQLQSLGQLSRGSIIAPEQPESPPRNAEGNYICVGFGCSNEKIFRIRSEWQYVVSQSIFPSHFLVRKKPNKAS
ncbi:hypothetical protein BGZ60DRAFT_27939 [Tricladium varicosporioides]|nr:hypothetical protein BGZ60DRAFT_27939 [Hymenoscyphus varicosporioides]